MTGTVCTVNEVPGCIVPSGSQEYHWWSMRYSSYTGCIFQSGSLIEFPTAKRKRDSYYYFSLELVILREFCRYLRWCIYVCSMYLELLLILCFFLITNSTFYAMFLLGSCQISFNFKTMQNVIAKILTRNVKKIMIFFKGHKNKKETLVYRRAFKKNTRFYRA